MRVTAPSLRRRNVARVEMKSRDRWLARRQSNGDQEEEDGDDGDGEDPSDTSDGSSDSADSSDSSDSEDEEEVANSPTPPATGGVGLITLPAVNNGAVVPGVTLGADEGAIDTDSDSDDDGIDDDEEETATAPPAVGGTPPAAAQPSAPATITSTPALSTPGLPQTTSQTAPAVSDVSSIVGDLLTSTPSAESTSLPTLNPDPSLTVPATGGAQQSGDSSVTTPERETLSAAPLQEANGMDGGAAAGIVIGVLAAIGLMIGAAFFWRKYRSARGLPFFPFALPFGKKKDGNDPYSANANVNPKTNTKIIDDLMKAAYDAENGGNDMAGVYWQEKYAPQLPEKKQSAWLDPKAFTALGGQLTPHTPKKPVSRWLEAVQTPRDSRGPGGFPPSERMSRQSRQSTMRFPIRLSTSPPRSPDAPQESNGLRPPMPGTMAGDRLEPPRPVYNARETMTTDTTNTSVRWYG
ncbi:hypothetical protein QBC44DRAFT_147622 [Cladorrhinum sp. PSN332]|nr:hypothetical protein QBC44DRAFT_147622 [Cladorrhinum sp. PSN332]